MTSRERLLTTIGGKRPDRVPVVVSRNLLGRNVFTEAESYRALVAHARSRADMLFKVHAGTIRYLDPYPRFNPNMQVEIDDRGEGGRLVTLQTPRGPLYKETKTVPGTVAEVLTVTTRHFIMEKEDIDRYLSIPYEPFDIGLDEVKEAMDMTGTGGVVQVSLWDAVGAVCDQIDPVQFAVWSVTDRPMIKRFVNIMHRRIAGELRRFLDAGTGELFLFNGPEYVIPPSQPPNFFDEFVTPYDDELNGMIHRHGKLSAAHCHGKTANFIDKFIDMGFDAIHPLEPPPSGDVDTGRWKKRHGKVCFIGNIEYTELSELTENEIRTRVRRLIGEVGGDGGLIVSPCSGLYELPFPEKTSRNYIAMIDAALEYQSCGSS